MKTNDLNSIFSGYRKTVSEIRPTNCPMYPSCSTYSEIAIENKGALGVILTTDRLLRCGHELNLYSTISYGKYKDIELLGIVDTLKEKKIENQFIYKDFSEDKDEQEIFFLHLVEKEMHREAILEYERMKFLNKENDYIFQVEYNYFRSLFALGLYEKIVQEIPKNNFSTTPLLNIKLSESYFKLENLTSAELTLAQIEDPQFFNKKNEFLGYVYAHNQKYIEAKMVYEKISSDYVYIDYVSKNISILNELMLFKKKSRTLGGILSVFPGGGYFYSKQMTTGLTSLILNSLLAFATVSSFKQNNYGVGVLSGIVGSAFYFGNILGGVKAVDRYNSNFLDYNINKMKYSYNN
ncbi:membrane protein insertion efficiency factor YidD [Algoriphagus antarcticus]|uniref:membrane protein insertion efficiency factor YidD n=1 Tax=Algoriphagus antarcticus TaxID=238540 RepID=UPI00196ACFBE|nr:membrane protein insertion efficiency factor YidD [Algoriphagus antarcticus]